MKFEDIQWQPGDKIQDSIGRWWTFVKANKNEGCLTLELEDDDGFQWGFTWKGWAFRDQQDDISKPHLLPETYKPIKKAVMKLKMVEADFEKGRITLEVPMEEFRKLGFAPTELEVDLTPLQNFYMQTAEEKKVK